MATEGPFPPSLEAGEDERLSRERQRLQKDAVSGSLWISFQTIVVLPAAVVANAVVAHALGASSYGKLAIYTAVYAAALSLLNAGISDASAQWIATHRARAEEQQLHEVVRRCAGYHVFVKAPVATVLVVVLLHSAGWIAVLVGGISTLLIMLVGTTSVVLTGSGLNALQARLTLATTLAGLTVIIAVAEHSPEATSIFSARLAVALLGPALGIFFIPRDLRSAVLRPAWPRHWPRGFLRFAAITCATGLLTTLVFGRSELFVFQAFGQTENAGIFALSAGVATLITAPIDSLLSPLLPATAGLLATTPERARTALLRGLRTSSILAGLIICLVIPAVAPLLPLVYGASFSEAAVPFIVLAVVSCFQSVSHPITAFIFAGRRTSILLRVQLMALVLDIAVAVATIPYIGVAGAVVASSLAQVSALMAAAFLMGRRLKTPFIDQVVASGYLADALVIGALAFAAESLATGLPAGAQAGIGLLVGTVGVAIGGRLRPRIGLTGSDIAVITVGFPRLLRNPFRVLVRLFAIELKSAEGSTHRA